MYHNFTVLTNAYLNILNDLLITQIKSALFFVKNSLSIL